MELLYLLAIAYNNNLHLTVCLLGRLMYKYWLDLKKNFYLHVPIAVAMSYNVIELLHDTVLLATFLHFCWGTKWCKSDQYISIYFICSLLSQESWNFFQRCFLFCNIINNVHIKITRKANVLEYILYFFDSMCNCKNRVLILVSNIIWVQLRHLCQPCCGYLWQTLILVSVLLVKFYNGVKLCLL